MSNTGSPIPIRSKVLQPGAFPGSSQPPFQPKLLLVEPEFELLANRTLLLTGSSYSVTAVSSENEMLNLQPDDGFSFVVLNDTLGPLALRSVAVCVRRTWPDARILILRSVESGLEDHLYDETVDYPFRPKALLDALVKLADDPWNQRPRRFGTSPGYSENSDTPLPSSPSTPLESDPTKADPHDLDAEKKYSPDIPGDEQSGQRA